MWFGSGLVMLYVPYPSLSPAETLARAQAIDWSAVTVPPPLDGGRLPQDLLLEMRDGVPVWRSQGWDDGWHTVPASEGRHLASVDAAYAVRVASRFGRARVLNVERIMRDQWTVSGGFDRHRPLWKATLEDEGGTNLYVSSSTGGIVQSTDRTERFWNWLGSVPHWLYPTVLRQDNAAWRQVVMWVSGPCSAAALAGIWIGILRARIGTRRFKGGRMTPYRGWMLWHHVAGLIGGGFLIAWIFSGWLSVDPWHLFRSAEPDARAVRAYASAGVMPAVPPRPVAPCRRGSRPCEDYRLCGDAPSWCLSIRMVDVRFSTPRRLRRLNRSQMRSLPLHGCSSPARSRSRSTG
nr:hypothetical protein [Sphingomonas sp. H160509]